MEHPEPFQDGSAGRLNIQWHYTNRISQHYMGNSCFQVLFCAVHLSRLTACIFHIKTLFDLKLIRFKKVDMLLNNSCSSQHCMMREQKWMSYSILSVSQIWNTKAKSSVVQWHLKSSSGEWWFLSKKTLNPSKKKAVPSLQNSIINLGYQLVSAVWCAGTRTNLNL